MSQVLCLQVPHENHKNQGMLQSIFIDVTSMFTDHGLLSVWKPLQTVYGRPDSVKYLNLTIKIVTETQVHISWKMFNR
jgi:hypothetical protein